MTTHTNKPSQVQFVFSLRDQANHAIVLPAQELQSATRIFEQGPGTQGWQEIDYKETSYFLHTAENFELEVMFVLDFTNSIAQARLPDGRSGIQAMSDAFRDAVAGLPGSHRIGVVEFHDRNVEPTTLSSLTTNRESVLGAVQAFMKSPFDPGSSRVWDSIARAFSLFTRREANPNVVRVVVFLSDGRDTSSSRTRADVASLAKKEGARLYALGVGDVFEENDLASLASDSGGAYYQVKELQAITGQLAQVVSDLRGQYKVSFITLRRTGSYQVRLQIAASGVAGSYESAPIDVAAFYGLDNEGRISFDPPSIDRKQGEAVVFVRALHVPRNISRFRFKLGTPAGKKVEISLVPKAEGGLLQGWKLAGPDGQGYYEVTSDQPLAFGNFGLLFRIALYGFTEERLQVPVSFDNSIYTAGKSFHHPAAMRLGEPMRIAFQSKREGNYEIYVMDADGADLRRLTTNPADDYAPTWSPDGKLIAFYSNRDGNDEVYVMNADGTRQRNLTNNSAGDTMPAWSPNGKLIAFASNRDGNYEIYVMNADGTSQRNLSNSRAVEYRPAWSPDGKLIAFASDRDGNSEIYVMNADGTNQRNLSNSRADEYRPAWSPDGKLVTFFSDRDGNNEVYIMNADGSGQRNLSNNQADDSFPAWSPDGELIAFYSNRDGNWEIYIMNADGTDQRRLTNNSAVDAMPAWSP